MNEAKSHFLQRQRRRRNKQTGLNAASAHELSQPLFPHFFPLSLSLQFTFLRPLFRAHRRARIYNASNSIYAAVANIRLPGGFFAPAFYTLCVCVYVCVYGRPHVSDFWNVALTSIFGWLSQLPPPRSPVRYRFFVPVYADTMLRSRRDGIYIKREREPPV